MPLLGLRRVAAIGTAVTLAVAMSLVGAAPAAGADGSVGYLRLAHLSPDTPKVDVYVAKIGDSSFTEQIFRHVGYGVMSKYLAVPTGTYAVAMRKENDPPTNAPVLTTQVTVRTGEAFTIAGVGRFSGLGLKVLPDDLTRPAADKAKVRIIQASVASPVLDVGLANGTQIAQGVQFASTTPYQVVNPGTWTLQLKPTGSGALSTLSCTLAAGSVYSLLVLDSAAGLRLELRADARGGATAPDGGVDTGAGGTSTTLRLLVVGVGVLLVGGLVAAAIGLRRARRRS